MNLADRSLFAQKNRRFRLRSKTSIECHQRQLSDNGHRARRAFAARISSARYEQALQYWQKSSSKAGYHWRSPAQNTSSCRGTVATRSVKQRATRRSVSNRRHVLDSRWARPYLDDHKLGTHSAFAICPNRPSAGAEAGVNHQNDHLQITIVINGLARALG